MMTIKNRVCTAVQILAGACGLIAVAELAECLRAAAMQDLADDVAESVGQMFSPSESDTAWHGACLAAAELAMRGLLLPARLPEFVPLVAQALHYDVRRGPHRCVPGLGPAPYELCVMHAGSTL